MGVIDVRHGAATRVASDGASVLAAPLSFLIALDRPSIAELHETRTLLEVHLAGAAAERRSPRDLEAVGRALADMKAALGDPKALTEPDVRFHRALAAASGNRILARIMDGLQERIRALIDAAWPGAPSLRFSWRRHAEIHRAVCAGRPAAARRAMSRHMDDMTRELRAVGLIPKLRRTP
jgi:GntR family transcriptional repressor for pyruvate dehydrogenase complex